MRPTINAKCARCHQSVRIPADATIIDGVLPGHECPPCDFCGHPRHRHPRANNGRGLRCNGIQTHGDGSLCTDCKTIAGEFLDRNTTIGVIWWNLFEDALAYFLPGIMTLSRQAMESRAMAWADITASHVYEELAQR
ncbi:hypothetical protein [Streptomyces luteogriseus]|uniref:hypothetical protein n=1 Tax=Streptomyces luteogriseus TaxID=68233 RepID=UPI0037AD8067